VASQHTAKKSRNDHDIASIFPAGCYIFTLQIPIQDFRLEKQTIPFIIVELLFFPGRGLDVLTI